MDKIPRYLGQAILYALFFVPLVYFTQAPTHQHLGPDTAILKIAVRHAGKIVGECTAVSAAQYANQAATVQRAEICPRNRSPLQLELLIDGDTLYSATVPASGLHDDGVSSMYRRFKLPAGPHRVQLLMNDDVSAEGYTWQLDQDIELQPAQVMVASFKEGFRLQ